MSMFYSLEEASQKLNKNADEIKQLVKDGQLREFRDGPNLLFKAEEVDALAIETDIPGLSDAEEPLEMEIPDISAEESIETEQEPELEEISFEDQEIPGLEPDMAEPELEMPEPIAEEPVETDLHDETEIEEIPLESEELPDFELEAPEEESEIPEPVAEEPEQALADSSELQVSDLDTAMPESAESIEEDAQEPAPIEDDELDNILLSPDSGAPVLDGDIGDLTNADTALPGQGTSILGLTDNDDYELTDDTMAETAITDGTKAMFSDDLDEIEEDVNLDSFGSGSGLLDLSLQADDTSLGGILDEIYTDESPEQAQVKEPGDGADMLAESEEMTNAEEALVPQLTPEIALPMAAQAAQAPDSQSNILGILLFIPFAAVLYATIVALSGMNGFLPSILTKIQIWV